MYIQLIQDEDHSNEDAFEKVVTPEEYTTLFKYNIICLIKKEYDPYPTHSEDSISFISKGKKDKAIWTLSFNNPGCIHVQSFEKAVIQDVAIYKNEIVLRSPNELASYVLAAIKQDEIKYPIDDMYDKFRWRISYGLKKEVEQESEFQKFLK